MNKLGIEYYCFHDVDIAPEGKDVKESTEYFKHMVDYIYDLQQKNNKKFQVTANNFSARSLCGGAATSCCADVYAAAAARLRLELMQLLSLVLLVMFSGGVRL